MGKALCCADCSFYQRVNLSGLVDCIHPSAPGRERRGSELTASDRLGNRPLWCPTALENKDPDTLGSEPGEFKESTGVQYVPTEIDKLSLIYQCYGQISAANGKIAGYTAENKQRGILGQSMAYGDGDYYAQVSEIDKAVSLLRVMRKHCGIACKVDQ